MKIGTLYGIGVGPGSVDLLTVKAVNLLAEAKVVCLIKSGTNKDSVALGIAKPYVRKDAEVMTIDAPMTNDESILLQAWQTGAKKIIAKLQEGVNVAFITLGDCMLFSTYTYILKQVKIQLPAVKVENVPGIAAYSYLASYLAVALAEGSENMAIIPAVNDLSKLPDILNNFPNVIIMKVAGKYEKILSIIDKQGLSNQAVYVSKLGHPDQLITFDLDSMRKVERHYLSILWVKRGGFA